MYERTDMDNGFFIKFAAAFAGIDKVCLEVEQFLRECGMAEVSFDVVLGLREALSNAVRHGSKLNASLTVDFSVQYEDGKIQARVVDQGVGFNWQGREKKILAKKLANAEETSGRGMSILYMYFDLCLYNKKGNELLLIKEI